MDKSLLQKHITQYVKASNKEPVHYKQDLEERQDLINYYQEFTKEKILSMNEEDIYEYISGLWAMLIWGNKHYVVDKIIEDNSLINFREHLAELVWGEKHISERWDTFRKSIKGMGPAMISEILCKTHPYEFAIWNKRAYIGLNYLKVDNLPRHDYQVNGKVYEYLCNVSKEISKEMNKAGINDASLVAVDYFIWGELQIAEEENIEEKGITPTEEELIFVHNDIRDKIRDIGLWLGFNAKIEQKVSDGSKVDAIWESTIGNMGRVIYVFEVQTKGSIDSLILNLLKSLNNAAVQGVIAVSDKEQIERIKKHSFDVKDLKDKLKFWDYEEILKVHESLEYVNSSINNLGLVPQGF